MDVADPHPFNRWPSLREVVEDYRTEHGWTRRICTCGNTHYYKRDNDASCQAYPCLDEYRFLDDASPNAFRTIRDVWNEAEEWLDDRGYPTESPASIENETGTTFLTVAGIQVFDEVFFDEAPASADPVVVAQPSIRTHSKEVVGEREGITTSFVNLATIRTDAGIEGYITDIDAWLNLLSELGLFVSDCSLVVNPPTVEDWGTGEFDKYAIKFVYKGLELGELGILRGFPQSTRGDLTVIDCGFSLERIAWALNRVPSFAAVIGPMRAGIHESIEYLDTVRTLTLMAGGRITPGPEGAGYRFRQLIGDLLDEDPTADCMELVRFYHSYWQDFMPLRDFSATRTRLRREVDRQYNQRFSGLANTPAIDQETDISIRELLSGGNSWEVIRNRAIENPASE